MRLDETDLVNLLEKGDLRQSINSLQSFHSLRTVPLNLLPTPSEYCKSIINAVFTANSVKQVYQISKCKLIQGKEMGYDEYPMDEVLTGFIDVITHTESEERKKARMMEVLSKCEEALILGATDLQYADVLSSLYYIRMVEEMPRAENF